MAGDGDEPDDPDELIDWLRNKSEDVWFDSAGHINWDDGVPVLMWMVDQPQCTQPLAASIFWAAAPDYYAAKMLEGQTFEEDVDESYALILRILKNWRAGLYARGNVAFEGPSGDYRALLARHPDRSDPLDVPEGLFASFPGRMSRRSAELAASANARAAGAKTSPFLRILGLILVLGSFAIAAALIAHRLRTGTW
jgi:hypothetical protein